MICWLFDFLKKMVILTYGDRKIYNDIDDLIVFKTCQLTCMIILNSGWDSNAIRKGPLDASYGLISCFDRPIFF